MEGMSINFAIIIAICSAIVTIAGAVTVLNKAIKSTIKKYSKEAIDASIKSVNETTDKTINDFCSNFDISIQSLRESTESSMKAFADRFNTDLLNLKKTIDVYIVEGRENDIAFKEALMSIIRDRINQAHSYYMSIGRIERHALFILEDMFKVYETKLGGNSFVKDLMADLRKLEKQ